MLCDICTEYWVEVPGKSCASLKSDEALTLSRYIKILRIEWYPLTSEIYL